MYSLPRKPLYQIIILFYVVCLPLLATAHIVPPEEFHPMVESYRRMMFMVNLNPVRWEEVRLNTDQVYHELNHIDPKIAADYKSLMDEIFQQVQTEISVSLATPGMRKRASHALYAGSTQYVSEGMLASLLQAKRHFPNQELTTESLELSRQLWGAFEFEVKHSDPSGHYQVGQAWLDASSALGSPGLLGVGEIAPNPERFAHAVQAIESYIRSNFANGSSFVAMGTWLQPLPMNSPTFDKDATIPVKLPPGHDINKQLPRPRQILNMAELGVDESETTLIALGDMAFDSPYIFGEPARSLQMSCNTCHNKGVTNPKFFIPGISSVGGGLDVSNSFFAPHANNGHYDPVDIPDLRGIRFTAPYGRNGRFTSLREFTRNVIVNEFNGAEPDPLMMDGMIAYMNEFDFLPNAHLNRDGTLKDSASDSARRGEETFNRPFAQLNNMSCASCHVPDNNFLDRRNHDIGTISGSSQYSLDRTMDTPTLLSSAYTAPYMHDGSLPTLKDVVDWFDSEHKLTLSADEKSDLTAYLETVGGGIDSYEDTLYTLDAEMEEFSFFLSSYTHALKQGKNELAATIFQTISAEIHAHKWDIQDAAYLPVLDDMAELMDAAYRAVLTNDLAETHRLVGKYREMYAANVDNLK